MTMGFGGIIAGFLRLGTSKLPSRDKFLYILDPRPANQGIELTGNYFEKT